MTHSAKTLAWRFSLLSLSLHRLIKRSHCMQPNKQKLELGSSVAYCCKLACMQSSVTSPAAAMNQNIHAGTHLNYLATSFSRVNEASLVLCNQFVTSHQM